MTEINLQDVNAVVQIIDTVTARGAFRGPELTGVGQLREKFAAVLQAEAEKQQATQPAVPTEEAAANEDAPAEEEGDLSNLK
jgi:hypothetical protein